jgi:hypothetical protein
MGARGSTRTRPYITAGHHLDVMSVHTFARLARIARDVGMDSVNAAQSPSEHRAARSQIL